MKRAIVIAGITAVALAPFAFNSQYLVNIAMLTALSAVMGQAWNIAGGFGQMTSFGHAAFFGVGAYTAAILQTRWGLSPWLGLPASFVTGGLLGGFIGILSFRAGLRGSYFALVTLAFAEVLRVLANSLDFTRGGLGINIPLKQGLANFQFHNRQSTYALVLLMLVLTTGVAMFIKRGRFGARLVAAGENEDAASALGVDLVRTKTIGLATSGAFTALAGVVYTQTYLYIDPSIAFGVERSIEMLLVAMIGGAGTIAGPILGAIALHAVAETSHFFIDAPGFAPLLYGATLLVIIGFLPRGIAGLGARWSRA